MPNTQQKLTLGGLRDTPAGIKLIIFQVVHSTMQLMDNPKIIKAEPILKWAGGKSQLLLKINKYIPEKFKVYHEPFAGGLAMFFYLRHINGDFHSYLSDANEELINCYNVVKEDLPKLIPMLSEHEHKHSKLYYYKTRKLSPIDLTPIERAARLIYLNKTCFNGLYRVNSKGQFNVPIGSYLKAKIFESKKIQLSSLALQNTTIDYSDFSIVLGRASEGDFIYFDPPYYTDIGGFTGYTLNSKGKAIFGAEEHLRLAMVAKELDKIGCNVLISNGDTKFIRNIYNQLGFSIFEVKARRAINCNGSERGPVTELVITNK
jgi:DNA adenine methylase